MGVRAKVVRRERLDTCLKGCAELSPCCIRPVAAPRSTIPSSISATERCWSSRSGILRGSNA